RPRVCGRANPAPPAPSSDRDRTNDGAIGGVRGAPTRADVDPMRAPGLPGDGATKCVSGNEASGGLLLSETAAADCASDSSRLHRSLRTEPSVAELIQRLRTARTPPRQRRRTNPRPLL